MTLHEAIEKILKDSGKPMSANIIADLINKGNLYIRGDKTPVPSSQIHARVNNYPQWFIKTGDGLITLVGDRQDHFNDIVLSVFDNLRNPVFTDINYLITSLFFYKRWLDYPEMLTDYQVEIKVNRNDALKAAGFKSFYNQLKDQLKNRNKDFDISLLDNISDGRQNLFKEGIMALEGALRILETISLDCRTYSVSEFGKRFSELFTRSYVNIRKMGEFSTPESLGELMVRLAVGKTDCVYYNPAGGYFNFPVALRRECRDKAVFHSEEIDSRTFSLGLLNLIANGASIDHVYNTDSISSSCLRDEEADVVLCNPPFIVRTNLEEYNHIYPYKSSNIVLYFLQLALRKAKYGGSVIMVVPESILFSQNTGIYSFRKYLTENNLIESVISLPAGIFEPYSSLKSSILILNKGKKGKKILFFDADRKEFFEKDHKGKVVLLSQNILKQFLEFRTVQVSLFSDRFKFDSDLAPSVVKEDSILYEIADHSYVAADIEEIKDNEFNLQAKRYFLNDLSNLLEENDEDGWIELKFILEPFYGKSSRTENTNLPYLNISDLNSDFTKIHFENYDQLKSAANRRGQAVDTSILMVGSVEGSLKPTLLEETGKKIMISRDILAFVPDFSKVDPEYLIYELAGIHVNQQVNSLSQGSIIKRIKSKDFLRIRIKLPSLDEQRKLVKTKKEAIVLAKINETFSLSDRLKISANYERKMLGALKHELAPLASIMKGGLKSIVNYLTKKIEEERIALMTDKISGSANSRTLDELLKDMEKSADELAQLTDNIQQIIDVGGGDIDTEEVELKKFISEIVENWEFRDKYNIVYHGELSSAPDVKANINRKQFAILVRNFLENTHRHGYLKKNEPYDLSALTGPLRNIVFNVLSQEGSVILDMINDGDPFAEDFSFNEFVSFGGHGGAGKGSGIGGFLMNRIIENHHGELLLLEPGESLIIPQTYKTNDNRALPMIQIIAGVYFRIILPDKNIQ